MGVLPVAPHTIRFFPVFGEHPVAATVLCRDLLYKFCRLKQRVRRRSLHFDEEMVGYGVFTHRAAMHVCSIHKGSVDKFNAFCPSLITGKILAERGRTDANTLVQNVDDS